MVDGGPCEADGARPDPPAAATATCEVDYRLEALTDGIVVHRYASIRRLGGASAAAASLPLAGHDGAVEVDELYQTGAHRSDDAFPIENFQLDLAPMTRAGRCCSRSTTSGCAAPTARVCARCAASDRNDGRLRV